jgi:hypothetical protein
MSINVLDRLEKLFGAVVEDDGGAVEGERLQGAAGLHDGDDDARDVVLAELQELRPDGHPPHAPGVVLGLADVRDPVERPGELRARRARQNRRVRVEQVRLPVRLHCKIRNMNPRNLQHFHPRLPLRRPVHSERHRLAQQHIPRFMVRRLANQLPNPRPRQRVAQRNRILPPRPHPIRNPSRRKLLKPVPAKISKNQ